MRNNIRYLLSREHEGSGENLNTEVDVCTLLVVDGVWSKGGPEGAGQRPEFVRQGAGSFWWSNTTSNSTGSRFTLSSVRVRDVLRRSWPSPSDFHGSDRRIVAQSPAVERDIYAFRPNSSSIALQASVIRSSGRKS